jgi:hypothetical protein
MINPKIDEFFPLYCDTDSVYLPKKSYELLLKTFGTLLFVESEEELAECKNKIINRINPTENELIRRNVGSVSEFFELDPKKVCIEKHLGQIQLEHNISECWFYNAKDYVYIDETNRTTIKLKGLHIKDYHDNPHIVIHESCGLGGVTSLQSCGLGGVTHLQVKQTAIRYNEITETYTGSCYEGLSIQKELVEHDMYRLSDDIPEIKLLHSKSITYDDNSIHEGLINDKKVLFSAYKLDPCALSILQLPQTKKFISKEEYLEHVSRSQTFSIGQTNVYILPLELPTKPQEKKIVNGYYAKIEVNEVNEVNEVIEYSTCKFEMQYVSISKDLFNYRLKFKPINFKAHQFKKSWKSSNIRIIQLYKTLA